MAEEASTVRRFMVTVTVPVDIGDDISEDDLEDELDAKVRNSVMSWNWSLDDYVEVT
jgi:hypothetical protein